MDEQKTIDMEQDYSVSMDKMTEDVNIDIIEGGENDEYDAEVAEAIATAVTEFITDEEPKNENENDDENLLKIVLHTGNVLSQKTDSANWKEMFDQREEVIENISLINHIISEIRKSDSDEVSEAVEDYIASTNQQLNLSEELVAFEPREGTPHKEVILAKLFVLKEVLEKLYYASALFSLEKGEITFDEFSAHQILNFQYK